MRIRKRYVVLLLAVAAAISIAVAAPSAVADDGMTDKSGTGHWGYGQGESPK